MRHLNNARTECVSFETSSPTWGVSYNIFTGHEELRLYVDYVEISAQGICQPKPISADSCSHQSTPVIP